MAGRATGLPLEATIDDADWRVRLRDAEDKVRLLEIENDALEKAVVREAKGHGLVYLLDQLGMRMRAIEDENASHRAFREGDRAQIRALAAEIDTALNGTALEKAHAEIKAWHSFFEQERAYQEDMIYVVGLLADLLLREGGDLPKEYHAWNNRRLAGQYDLIPIPGGSDDGKRPEAIPPEEPPSVRWGGLPDGGPLRPGETGPFLEPGGPAAVSGGSEDDQGSEADLHGKAGDFA